jgi:hypothetical protein
MQAQPPEIAIRLLEYISILPLSIITGKQMLHPDMLYVVGLYNILISLITLFLFFRILLKLGFTFELSLTGLILLGTLFNYNIYTRHILPYESALMFQLAAFNLLLRPNLTYRAILIAGLLSVIGLTNYLGGFMFIFINGGYLIFSYYKNPRLAFKYVILFSLPFVLLLLFYEVLCRANGMSYIFSLSQYYDTVYTEASLDEGLIYLFLYFYMVEKCWGIAILVLFFVGGFVILRRSDTLKMKQVLLLGIVAYVVYGGYVYFIQTMPFHGRILHMYYPFVIMGVLGFVQYQKLLRSSYMALCMILLASVNYAFVIHDFNRLGYPRSALYRGHLFEEKNRVGFTYYSEIENSLCYEDRADSYIDSMGETRLQPGQYVLVNFCFLNHYPDSFIQNYKPFVKQGTDSVIYENTHFQSHPAYTFEYCTRPARHFFIDKQIKLRVIKAGHHRDSTTPVQK